MGISVAMGNNPEPHALSVLMKRPNFRNEAISITAPATMIVISPGVGCLLSTGSSEDTSSQRSQTRRRRGDGDFGGVSCPEPSHLDRPPQPSCRDARR